MDLGIVIVNWNVKRLLAACLDSVYLDLAQSAGRLSAVVCVVDNGSSDGSVDLLRRQFPHTLVLETANLGMGAGNNRGLRALAERADPWAMLVLNPDTVVRPGALAALVEHLRSRPRAGVAAPRLLSADGGLQHSGFRFPGLTQLLVDLFPPPGRLARLVDSPLNGRYPEGAYRGGVPFEVDHTLGAAFAVRAEVIRECGLFDETFYMYCEEIDWQWRLARAGWERWVVPAAEVVHLGAQSTGQQRARSFVHLWASRRRLYQRYHSPALNALAGPFVQVAMRRRIRANHRRSQRGQMSPDERAEMNQAINEVIHAWHQRRAPLAVRPAPE
jgi:GT2 family glycosyltransferase